MAGTLFKWLVQTKRQHKREDMLWSSQTVYFSKTGLGVGTQPSRATEKKKVRFLSSNSHVGQFK